MSCDVRVLNPNTFHVMYPWEGIHGVGTAVAAYRYLDNLVLLFFAPYYVLTPNSDLSVLGPM